MTNTTNTTHTLDIVLYYATFDTEFTNIIQSFPHLNPTLITPSGISGGNPEIRLTGDFDSLKSFILDFCSDPTIYDTDSINHFISLITQS